MLPEIEELALGAHVSPSPARAEPHDPDAWLPLPHDLDALPSVEVLLAPPPELQSSAVEEAEAILRDAAAAVAAVVSPSPTRAEPHDAAAWLPVPDPDLLDTLPELEAGEAAVARTRPRRRTRRGLWALGIVLVLVAGATGAILSLGTEDAQVATVSAAATPVTPVTFPVSVDLDGVVRTVDTSARTAKALMSELAVGKLVALRADPGALQAGSSVVLRTRHNGTLLVDGQRVEFDSASHTVAELLGAYHVVLFGDDYVQPGLDQVLTDGGTVEVFRVGGETRQETQPIPFGEVQQQDPNTLVGQTSELQAGVDGLATDDVPRPHRERARRRYDAAVAGDHGRAAGAHRRHRLRLRLHVGPDRDVRVESAVEHRRPGHARVRRRPRHLPRHVARIRRR